MISAGRRSLNLKRVYECVHPRCGSCFGKIRHKRTTSSLFGAELCVLRDHQRNTKKCVLLRTLTFFGRGAIMMLYLEDVIQIAMQKHCANQAADIKK